MTRALSRWCERILLSWHVISRWAYTEKIRAREKQSWYNRLSDPSSSMKTIPCPRRCLHNWLLILGPIIPETQPFSVEWRKVNWRNKPPNVVHHSDPWLKVSECINRNELYPDQYFLWSVCAKCRWPVCKKSSPVGATSHNNNGVCLYRELILGESWKSQISFWSYTCCQLITHIDCK